MPIQESVSMANNLVWTYFKNTPSISLDNAAVMVFYFHRIKLTETVSIWCRPQILLHIRFVKHVIKNVTMYFETYWNNSGRILTSPESKVDHVAIWNLQDEVKQILGFVFYRYNI